MPCLPRNRVNLEVVQACDPRALSAREKAEPGVYCSNNKDFCGRHMALITALGRQRQADLPDQGQPGLHSKL